MMEHKSNKKTFNDQSNFYVAVNKTHMKMLQQLVNRNCYSKMLGRSFHFKKVKKFL